MEHENRVSWSCIKYLISFNVDSNIVPAYLPETSIFHRNQWPSDAPRLTVNVRRRPRHRAGTDRCLTRFHSPQLSGAGVQYLSCLHTIYMEEGVLGTTCAVID